MKTIITFFFIGLLLISSIDVSVTIACTIVTVSNGETVLFGGNEDQTSNSSFLVVDTSGTFGVVYFATPWKQWPLARQMGINEMGLSYDCNWIPREELTPHPERNSQSEWVVIKLMKEASTVEEVLSKIFTYNFGDSMEYQIHFADKSGNAAVIHPGADGELTYTRKPKGNGYLVSTNFNLAQLNKGNWSCSRYKAADKMLSKIKDQRDLTVEFMASVLNATHQDRLLGIKTLYSAIYDLKTLRIYLYYERQFNKPYVLDIKQELSKTTGYRKISLKKMISNMDMQKKQN